MTERPTAVPQVVAPLTLVGAIPIVDDAVAMAFAVAPLTFVTLPRKFPVVIDSLTGLDILIPDDLCFS